MSVYFIVQEWGLEGYQLWMLCEKTEDGDTEEQKKSSVSQIMQLQFVKSALTVNPCMVRHTYILLFKIISLGFVLLSSSSSSSSMSQRITVYHCSKETLLYKDAISIRTIYW